jgi:hypothetical protein
MLMMKIKDISFRTEGTSDLSRHKEAINPSFFGIDERSLSDILTFISAYSKKVRYMDYQNKPAGDWSPFLENNLAFVIAHISCKDLDAFNTISNCY